MAAVKAEGRLSPRHAYAASPTDHKSGLRVLLVYQTSTKRFTAAFPASPMSQHPLLRPINSTIPNNKPADGFLFFFFNKQDQRVHVTSLHPAPTATLSSSHQTLYNTAKGGKTHFPVPEHSCWDKTLLIQR